MKRKCPHCGNTNAATIESNGLPRTHADYTLLCVAKVKPEDSSFDVALISPDQIDENGLTPCGMQWEPNAPD